MAQFDWQTEDDTDWEDINAPQPNKPQRSTTTIATALLVLVALLGVASWVIYNRITDEIDTATTDIENDVLDSLELLYEMANDGDIEVFQTLLSGRDREWTSAQQLLVGDGRLLDRSPFGLSVQSAIPEVNVVEMSPNLLAATITSTIAYESAVTGEVLDFDLPTIFRKGDAQWLYAPPEIEFWGTTETFEGTHVRGSFPSRDAALAGEISAEINRAFQLLCSTDPQLSKNTNIPCETATIFIDFTTAPNSLVSMRAVPYANMTISPITLPTPSLVGLPTDQASADALMLGYAKQVLVPWIAAYTSYQCCDENLSGRDFLFSTLIDEQMRQLGFQVPTFDVAGADPYAIWLESISFDSEFEVSENVTVDHALADLKQAHGAFINFLIDELPNVPYSVIFRAMAATTDIDEFFGVLIRNEQVQNSGSEWSFFSSIQPYDAVFGRFDRYMRQKTNQFVQPPIPYPDKDIVVACGGSEASSSPLVLRYDLTTLEWGLDAGFEQIGDLETINLIGLPNYDGYYFEEDGPNSFGSVTKTGIIREGSLYDLGLNNSIPPVYYGQSSPSGNELFMYLFSESDVGYGTLNLGQCTKGNNCAIEQLDGVPVWSENEDYTLLLNYENSAIIAFNRQGEELKSIALEDIRGANWIDNENFAWIGLTQDVIKTNIVNGSQETIATFAQWSSLIPDGTPPYSIFHPVGANIYGNLYFNVNDAAGNIYILQYRSDINELAYIEELGKSWYIKNSPSGRFLVAGDLNGNSPSSVGNVTYAIYDVSADTFTNPTIATVPPSTAPQFDGTDDWFMFLANDELNIHSPTAGFELNVSIPSSLCTSATWVNK